MKFGKKIQEAAHASVALCSENCWLDYKRLKKVLKSFDFTPLQAEKQNLEVQNDAVLKTGKKDAVHMIKQNKDERRFFALLKKELEKVSNMFVCLEERSMNEVFQVLDALNVEAEKRQDQDVAELLSELVRVHGKLVLVRNFAVINYIGFTKILKKHDKVTGFTTRDKFMLKLVSDVPFSKHEALKCALEVLQSEYEAAKADGCIARNPKRNLLARELSMQALRQRQHRARSCSVASHSPQMLGFTASPMQANKSIQLKRLLAPESVSPNKKVKVDVKNSLVSLATAAEIHTTKAT